MIAMVSSSAHLHMSEVPQDPSVEEDNTEEGEECGECYVEIRPGIRIFTGCRWDGDKYQPVVFDIVW